MKSLEGVAQIGIDDFAKVDLRVCEVKTCEPVKKSKKLLQFTIFDGVKDRTVVSGIANYYKPEEPYRQENYSCSEPQAGKALRC